MRVSVDGEVVAETRQPKLLYETGLPVRYYIPPADVRTDVLSPTDTHTVCPYKGTASYWTLSAGDRTLTDVAFGYPDPLPEAMPAKDHLCFMGDGVDVEVSAAA